MAEKPVVHEEAVMPEDERVEKSRKHDNAHLKQDTWCSAANPPIPCAPAPSC